MTKILFTAAITRVNKGDAARAFCTFKTLRKIIPDADLSAISMDTEICKGYNVRAVWQEGSMVKSLFRLFRAISWGLLHKIGLDVNRLINNDMILNKYASSDVIISLSGEGFTDDLGIFGSISSSLGILLCMCLGKPFVFYSTSIGPFKTKLTLALSRFVLNRGVKLVIARDEITKNYLEDIGINKEIPLLPDPAFLLQSSPSERIKEILLREGVEVNDRPIIGINASQHIDQHINRILKSKNLKLDSSSNYYIQLMAKTVDYLVEKIGAQIIFVPTVVVPVEGGYDDRCVAEKIYRIAKNKDNIKLIKNEYTPEETMGIIGMCDLFMGARMHASIFAALMHVPCVPIAYSHKTHGVMKMFGLEDYVWDFRTMTFDELISKINNVWKNREKIKKNLSSKKIEDLKESALLNGKLVKDLLDSFNKSPK